MGLSLSGPDDRGALVRAREREWHINCLKLLAAILTLQIVTKGGRGISDLLRIDNTVVMAYINNQGGNSFKGPSPPCIRPVDVGHGEKYPHHSPTSARGTHVYGRHRVLDNVGPVGLESRLHDTAPHQLAIESSRGGLVYLQTAVSVPSLFQLAGRSVCAVKEAFLQDWLDVRGIANPPWNPVDRVLAKSRP